MPVISPLKWRHAGRLLIAIGFAMFSSATAAQVVEISWKPVGAPGNPPDATTSAWGSVAYHYSISEFEITNEQYAGFLNHKAVVGDPLGLYDTRMGTGFGGIARAGMPGAWVYNTIPGRADMPVNYVSIYDAMRFANWMNNGQVGADTESGAYTLLGGTADPSNGATVPRNPDALIAISNGDEWYKAAYYDTSALVYYDYPTGTDIETTCAAPPAPPNSANCQRVVDDVTMVGSYSDSPSPNGTFDQAANAWEWSDDVLGPLGSRNIWGGAYDVGPDRFFASGPGGNIGGTSFAGVSFRLVRIGVPDADGDGVEDGLDNCTEVANPSQLDADGDNFGNACDADFNQDCVVAAVDLGILKLAFFSADPVVDINEDGIVNALDLGLFRTLFFLGPGPTGLPNACQGG